MQEDDGGRTVKVEVSLLVLRLPPGVPLPAPASAAAAARNTLAVVDPAATSSGGSHHLYIFNFIFASFYMVYLHLYTKNTLPFWSFPSVSAFQGLSQQCTSWLVMPILFVCMHLVPVTLSMPTSDILTSMLPSRYCHCVAAPRCRVVLYKAPGPPAAATACSAWHHCLAINSSCWVIFCSCFG